MSESPANGHLVHDDASSILAPGTLCSIIAGCPENIGMVVSVVGRIGTQLGYQDGYHIRTITGRTFAQLWTAEGLAKGASTHAFTERWKLRPLVTPPVDAQNEAIEKSDADAKAAH